MDPGNRIPGYMLSGSVGGRGGARPPSRNDQAGQNVPLPTVQLSEIVVVGIPQPPKNLPGGPWTETGPGQRPGHFSGPRQASGPRAALQWVPSEANGGPPGSRGYWKLKLPGLSVQRYNQAGRPITAQQAHPGRQSARGPGDVIAQSVRGGPIVAGVVTFFTTLFWPTPAY